VQYDERGEKMTEAQKKTIAKYNKLMTWQFNVKLNKKTDADIIEVLKEKKNRTGYLKGLVREDIGKKGV
jgi:hypothetical protein